MSYESFIGLRYLMAKQRSRVLSIITLIAVFGVAIGVMALIVVLSVMGGFKTDLTDKILGARAHIVIQAPDYGSLDNANAIADKVMDITGVVGASPFVESEVMVSSPTNIGGVVLRGIDPSRVNQVSDLTKEIVEGKLEFLVDSQPLLDEIRRERDADLDELLQRLDKERRDLAKGSNGNSAAIDTTGDDAVMPPIFATESSKPSDNNDVSDSMPSLFDEPDSPASKPRIPGLIIGPELAKSLQVQLGDEVNVVTPRGEIGPMGPIPRSRPFRIVGIFYSGMYEYDANFAYTYIDDAANLLNLEGATGVELRTYDINASVAIASEIQRQFGNSVEVLDWQEMNRSLFFALKLEKIAMFVVLTFIILVASFSIVAMLIMIVIEKGREIAILKSMGANDRSIRRIFMIQGATIGTVGTVLGLIFGLSICYFLATIGFPLNSEVYYISTLPVDINPVEISLVVLCSMLISLLATIYPASQAARLKPVDGLRYD